MEKDDALLLFTLAYALDWLVGDPEWAPHPVRWMGRLIQVGEGFLRRLIRTPRAEFVGGLLLSLSVVGVFGVASWRLLGWLGGWNRTLAFVVALYFAVTTLATRSLLDEARAVRRLLASGDLPAARRQVARIVGRDTHELDESEVTRAVIETLAESASDGVGARSGLAWRLARAVAGRREAQKPERRTSRSRDGGRARRATRRNELLRWRAALRPSFGRPEAPAR